MGIRELYNRVRAEVAQGRSKLSIYQELTSKAPSEAGKIAYCLASVPEEPLRRSALVPNALLCLLLVVYAVLNLLGGLPLAPGEPTLFLALTTLIPLVFSYFVFHFFGGVYRLAGIWFSLDLLETLLLAGAPDGLAVLRLLVLFAIVVLSFFLARRVFPQLGILGPKRNGDGGYML